jgi:rhamnosyltransferase
MANSGLRKDIWSRRGFLETLQYSEDDEYTRWCRAQGYGVVYCPESIVVHSHNYTPRQAYRRGFGEGHALAVICPEKRQEFNWPRHLVFGWLNDLRRDFQFCARTGCLREWPHAGRIRWQQRCGRRAGFMAGWKATQERILCKAKLNPIPGANNLL